MRRSISQLTLALGALMGLMLLAACAAEKKADVAVVACPTLSGPSYTLSGQITYHYVPATYSAGTGISKINYSSKTTKPARRVVVQAILPDCSSGNVVASTTTDDDGNYSMSVPSGAAVKVRALAQLYTTSYTPDSTLPNHCSGASWDIRVVDNTQSRAQYAVDSSSTYSGAASNANILAPLTWNTSPWTYTSRAAAPFAILDTIVSELEMVCEGAPTTNFPLLYVNWSENNTNASGDYAVGNIGTSFFTKMDYGNAMYILGKANVDTDEYDDHVIAHEFGHYIESALFRSDTVGGAHSFGVLLDPRVAFSEGWGNAVSGMALGDSEYVDTNGSQSTGSNTGIRFTVDTAPTGNDRGLYSEKSVQYFLYKLWDNNSQSFTKLYNTWLDVKTSAAFTSLQSFASYYNHAYGDGVAGSPADSGALRSLWATSLDMPFNSLCSGACVGTGDAADPYDLDNDLGEYFKTGGTSPRKYPATGATYGTEFWRLYRTLSSSSLHTATAHDQANDGSYGSYAGNRFGFIRWYRYTGTGTSTTIAVESPASAYGGCTTDLLDLVVQRAGSVVTYDIAESGLHAGCPTVTFTAQAGVVYVIEVRGVYNTSSYNIRVTP